MNKLPLPTPEQVVWHHMELGMFIHWAPYIYTEQGEHGSLVVPPEKVTAQDFDPEQWVQTAIDLGAKYIVFVAKHAGGFAMWQTDTTPYGVNHIAWKDGKGDIVKELSEVCRRRGIRLGLYLSPADAYKNIGVGARAKNPDDQAAYNETYRQQLTELLTRYGELVEIWFDGDNIVPLNDIIEKYAPHIVVFQSKKSNIRWVGNEMGIARYPAWNGVRTGASQSTATQIDGDPDGDTWKPLECDTTIRRGWFWSPDNADTLKSVETLMETYYMSVGHGAVLLLNSNPDRTGRIPEADANRAKEFGDMIRRLYSSKITGTAGGEGDTYTVDLGDRHTIDHIMLSEDIALGERIRGFRIEGILDGKSFELGSGSAVGNKHIIHLPPTEVDKVILHITAAVDTPHVTDFSVYYANLGLPVSEVAYDADTYQKIGEWGRELFYGRGTGKCELKISLNERFLGESDVGQYEILLKEKNGNVALTAASLTLGDVDEEHLIKVTDDNRCIVTIPGISRRVTVKLTVNLPTADSRGTILMRKVS